MPAKPDRAPMHYDADNHPPAWRQPRHDARVPGMSEAQAEAAAKTRAGISDQPANGERFPATADFSEPARRSVPASRQSPNMEPLAWFDIIDALIERAQAQHDHAATRTRMALFDTIVRWLEQQRETPPA